METDYNGNFCFLEQLVNWCFEPGQPLGDTSGLNTNSIYLLLTLHTSHLTSTTILLQYFISNTHTRARARAHTHTHTHTHTHFSTKPQTFYITIIFLHTKFTLKYLILYRTYQSLSGSQNLFSGFTFRNSEYQDLSSKYFSYLL